MAKVTISELRRRLSSYLQKVRNGEEIDVTMRGKVIARIVPFPADQAAARRHLAELRKRGARITGDVISPSGEEWDAER